MGDVVEGAHGHRLLVQAVLGYYPILSDQHSDDGTFLDYVKNYVTTLGEDVSFTESRLTATTTIQQELEDGRDSVSGVVVDEEVANMMLYNKSLSAASRLMTAMDEALDTIINKTGLVGR